MSPGWHVVELDWRAASPGAEGRLDLTLDGIPQTRLKDLENPSGRIDSVLLGVAGADPGSGGFVDLDEYLSQPQL